MCTEKNCVGGVKTIQNLPKKHKAEIRKSEESGNALVKGVVLNML